LRSHWEALGDHLAFYFAIDLSSVQVAYLKTMEENEPVGVISPQSNCRLTELTQSRKEEIKTQRGKAKDFFL